MLHITVICDKCNSFNVQHKIEFRDLVFSTAYDLETYDKHAEIKRKTKVFVCKCNDCGYEFEENLGTYIFPLKENEVWLD